MALSLHNKRSSGDLPIVMSLGVAMPLVTSLGVLKPQARSDSIWYILHYQGTLKFDLNTDFSNLIISKYQYQSEISTLEITLTFIICSVVQSARIAAVVILLKKKVTVSNSDIECVRVTFS